MGEMRVKLDIHKILQQIAVDDGKAADMLDSLKPRDEPRFEEFQNERHPTLHSLL